MTTVPDIEQACKGTETGKNKIGKILLAHTKLFQSECHLRLYSSFAIGQEAIPEQKQEPKTGQNPIAQRIIGAMEKPPHLTYEDGEALRQSIEEGKMPVEFDSPFEPGEREEQ